jgi:hypothetical protein
MRWHGTDAARALSRPSAPTSRVRKTFGGGRPRKNGARCPCAVMTLKRAKARERSSEHDPSCSF